MKKIHVLSPGFTSPNSAAFLFPLIKFAPALKDHGFQIHIIDTLDEDTTQCEFLMIDSKFFKTGWGKDFDTTLQKIKSLGAQTKILWCDQGDSSGTFLGQVVPYVHRYLKAQIIKDKTEYMRSHYASRIYTDYYHKKYEIIDKDPYIDHPVKNAQDLDKIGVSWNSGFMNYGLIGPYLMRAREIFPLNALLHFARAQKNAAEHRSLDVTCRMGISYARDTVRYQRLKIRDALSQYVPTDKLSRSAYFKEMENSKICVSPFGLGEITLKDFECFLSGSLLLKPDMSHMDTWPNFFESKQTCLFHDWDLKDLQDQIDWALSHEKLRIEIAQNAQDLYVRHTINKDADLLFAKYFSTKIMAD